MKKYFLVLSFVGSYSFTFAQYWQPLGKGLDHQMRELFADSIWDKLYAGGNFEYADSIPVNSIAQWDGSKWDSLGAGNGLNNCSWACPFFSITRYGGKIYASSYFSGTSLGKWDGTSWSFPDTVNGMISRFFVDTSNNNLYLVGSFNTINGVFINKVARYDGTNWYAMGNINWTGGHISDIIQYNNEIYICGNMWQNPFYKIARWNGTTWNTVGGGIQGTMSAPYCMAVYNGELYVGGSFTVAEGNVGNYIQKWNGSSWSDVGGGITSIGNGGVSSLKVHNNELYVAGWFHYAGGVPAHCLAKWDGAKWCGFGDTLFFPGGIADIDFFRDTMYIGGGFHTIDGDTVNYIAKWTGGLYTDTCGNANGVNENHISPAINIFPNPASSYLIIDMAEINSEPITIIIYNTVGQMVTTVSEKTTGKNYRKEMDIANLAEGFYILTIHAGEKTVNQKVMIIQ